MSTQSFNVCTDQQKASLESLPNSARLAYEPRSTGSYGFKVRFVFFFFIWAKHVGGKGAQFN